MADGVIRQKVMIQKEMSKRDLIAFIASEEMCKKEMPTYSSDSYLEVNATSTYKQQGRAKRAPQQQQRPQEQWCDHCKTNGHPHDHCWKTNACRRCSMKGHVEKNCPGASTGRPRQNNNAISRRVVFSLTIDGVDDSVLDKPRLDVLVKIDGAQYSKQPHASNCRVVETSALADTGADVCIMGSEIWGQLGATKAALLPSDIDLSAANGESIPLCGMAYLEIVVADDPGDNRTREPGYITKIKEQSLFLSLAALRQLKSVNKDFPRPAAN